jgi:hypothetical protein
MHDRLQMLQIRAVEFPQVPQQPRAIPRPPDFGALSTTDAHPAVVSRSEAEIINGFVGQQLRMTIGHRLICVTASQGADPAYPFEHPVLVMSTSVRANGSWPDTHGLELDVLPAVALAADRQWLDRMLVVRDTPQAWTVAARFGAQYLLQWTQTGMAVVEVASRRVVRRFAVRARELTHRCCPVIADARPGDRCRMYGGGSVSRAIVAAGHWLDRRYVFLEELGCDEACGMPTVRRDPQLPTRYLRWLTEREISAEWAGIVGLARTQPDGGT